MIRKNHFLIFLAVLLFTFQAYAQGDRKDKTAVTYEEIYDEPYSINKLFVQIQPLYGDLFATNVNAGFGLETTYYQKDKFDIHAGFRKSYSQKFYDFTRDLAIKNSTVDNRAQVFTYYELGGTYHIKDFEQSSKTKMFLFKNSYKGNKWAARVPLSAEIPCKVRKIYGVRLGGIVWNSSVDVNRVLAKQKLTMDQLKTADGISLPDTLVMNGESRQMNAFTNIYTINGYVGGSITWIRNVAVNFDKFEEGIDDLILTAYFDILVAPSIKLDDIYYTGSNEKNPGNPDVVGTNIYKVSPIKTQSFGFRAGLEGKFNRTWGWSYGGEVGYRPGIQGQGFYALIKIAFPVFSTNLDYKVESFGK